MLFGVWGMAPVRRYSAGKNAQRAVNAKQGHDGSKSRPIDHFAYFPTHEGQMLYRDFLVPRGYSITREAMDASQTARWGIEFSSRKLRTRSTEKLSFSAQRLQKFGGEYDGWGTEVEAS